jgi:hypothetical protein
MVIERLQESESEDVKVAFIKLMESYIEPSFGSISKRDFEIGLFATFQKLGVFDNPNDLFEIVSQLKITKTKARNLLYEVNLRKQVGIEDELKKLLLNPIFLKDNNNMIALEVENPFLIDYLKMRLKKMGHITDGSFSPEIVKLQIDAFLNMFEQMFLPDEKEQEKVRKALVACGASTDNSFKAILKDILIATSNQIGGEAGERLVTRISDILEPIASSTTSKFKSIFSKILKNKEV